MALNPNLRKAVAGAVNKYGRSDGKRIKPKEGRNVYRIVAPMQASWIGPNGEFWVDLGVHWIKTALNAKPLAVVGSRDVCYGEPCPVGMAVEMAKSRAKELSFDEDTVKIIDEMRVVKSVLFNAADRTTNANNEDLDILELKPSAAQQILDLMMQYDDAGADIFDLNTGLDIVVTRTGKGMNTEYTVNVKPGVSAPMKVEALNKCHDLRDHIEKEFFRGDEQKAIKAIQQIAGISTPMLASSASLDPAALAAAQAPATPTAALTSAGAVVPDATVDAGALAAAQAAQAAAQNAALEAQRLQNEANAAAQAAATQAAAAAAPTVSTVDPNASDDIDDVLAQLANL